MLFDYLLFDFLKQYEIFVLKDLLKSPMHIVWMTDCTVVEEIEWVPGLVIIIWKGGYIFDNG